MATRFLSYLENVLVQVRQDRRGFLETLIMGSVIATPPAMVSQAVAAEDGGDEGKKKKKKKKKEGS